MGPNRQNWTFPCTAEWLLRAIKQKEVDLVAKIDEALDDDVLAGQRREEFRQMMRQAGVIGWEHMELPNTPPWNTYRGVSEKAKDYYGRLSKSLLELQRYRRAFEREIERDPFRTFKLTHDDLEFLGL